MPREQGLLRVRKNLMLRFYDSLDIIIFMLPSDLLFEVEDTFKNLPHEIGTEAVAQAKGNQKHLPAGRQAAQAQSQSSISDDQQRQYLQDLYGISDATPAQIEQKQKQDIAIRRQRYQKIQQEIAEFRVKQRQQKTKHEIGWQEGTQAAKTQEEEMELWEKEKEKQEKKKKEQEKIMLPGSQQKKSGEMSKIMG